MARRVELVFGPPGTGKTTHVMQTLHAARAAGLAPEEIAFLSFSRRAVREAAERLDGHLGDYPFFRTIHAMAFRQLGLSRHDVLHRSHLEEFAARAGLEFTSRAARAEETGLVVFDRDGTLGDKCLALHGLARARGTSLAHEWRQAQHYDLPWRAVRDTVQAYERYKDANALWDFHDMITRAEGALPGIKLFVVDEAQDTSTAQWALLRRLGAEAPRVVIAGDDDQTVYHWSGADPTPLWTLRGEHIHLPQSFRVPSAIKRIADRIVKRIRRREPKTYAPRPGTPGNVLRARGLEGLDLHTEDSWLLLARTNFQTAAFRQFARMQGVVYTLPDGRWSWELPAVRAALAYERLRRRKPVNLAHAKHVARYLRGAPPLPSGAEQVTWDTWSLPAGLRTLSWMEALRDMSASDREYVRMLRRSGESLSEPGRVRIGTVHSVKGAEADQVVLLTDLTARIDRAARLNADAELRVQYVAVTRARERLVLIEPTSPYAWTF